MGQCPGKRNVDWNGGRMGKEQRYDRPTPLPTASTPFSQPVGAVMK